MLACSFAWISPSFQYVSYPLTMHIISWITATITLLIILIAGVYTIIEFTKKKVIIDQYYTTINKNK